MKNRGDFEDIIRELEKKKSLREADLRKLNTFLTVLRPDDTPVSSADGDRLERIRGDLHSEIRSRGYTRFSPLRMVKRNPAFVMGLAAVFLVTILIGRLYRYDSRDTISGTIITQGDVTINRNGHSFQVSGSDRIVKGDRLIVPEGSGAELVLGRNIRVFLPPSSDMIFDQGASARYDISLHLLRGSAAVTLEKLAKTDNVELLTPLTRAVVKGTSFAVRINLDGSVRYEVYDGKIRLAARIPDNMKINSETRGGIDATFDENAVDLERNTVCTSELTRDDIARLSGGAVSSAGGFFRLRVVKPYEFQLDTMFPSGVLNIRRESVSEPKPSDNGDHSTLAGYPDYLLVWKKINIEVRRGVSISASSPAGILWSRNFEDSPVTRPLIVDNRIHLFTGPEFLQILDPQTGAILKRVRLGAAVHPLFAPVTDGKVGYSVLTGGVLLCIDQDGNILWRKDLTGQPSSYPAWNDQLVFIALDSGYIIALDRRSGLIVLRFQTECMIETLCALQKSVIYITGSGMVSRYSIEGDETLWSIRLNGSGRIWAFPEADGAVILFQSGETYRLSSRGKVLWQKELPGKIIPAPVFDGETVYAASGGDFFALNCDSGDIRWSCALKEEPTGPPILINNEIFYLSSGPGVVTLRK